MLYFNFYGFEGFKARFGMVHHGNGEKSRKNKILLSFVKTPFIHEEAVKTGDYSLLNITNMADLKNIMFDRIQKSGNDNPELGYEVNILNYTFKSALYETDDSKGLCEDGDDRACRYVNHSNNDKIFKMKAGKFIRSLILETEFGQKLPEQVVVYLQECFAQEWQTYAMSVLPKNRLVVDEDFQKIYSSRACVGDFCSCMVNRHYHSFYKDAVDAKAAYLLNEDGLIISRCIIYTNVHEEGSDKIWRLAERQYSTDQNDVLKRALVDALIREDYIDGYKQVGFDCHNSRGFVDIHGNSLENKKFWIDCSLDTWDTLSYQDSFKWYNFHDKAAYNYETNNYDYCLDTTEGSIDGNDEDDDDGENYDSYHDRYTYHDVVTVWVGGDSETCDEDDLEDFIYIDDEGWVHEDDVSECPVCGKKFISANGSYSELTDCDYCDSECMAKAELQYKKENWTYSEYDDEYVENADDVSCYMAWDPVEQVYEKKTIKKYSLAKLIAEGTLVTVAFDCIDEHQHIPYNAEYVNA